MCAACCPAAAAALQQPPKRAACASPSAACARRGTLAAPAGCVGRRPGLSTLGGLSAPTGARRAIRTLWRRARIVACPRLVTDSTRLIRVSDSFTLPWVLLIGPGARSWSRRRQMAVHDLYLGPHSAPARAAACVVWGLTCQGAPSAHLRPGCPLECLLSALLGSAPVSGGSHDDRAPPDVGGGARRPRAGRRARLRAQRHDQRQGSAPPAHEDAAGRAGRRRCRQARPHGAPLGGCPCARRAPGCVRGAATCASGLCMWRRCRAREASARPGSADRCRSFFFLAWAHLVCCGCRAPLTLLIPFPRLYDRRSCSRGRRTTRGRCRRTPAGAPSLLAARCLRPRQLHSRLGRRGGAS